MKQVLHDFRGGEVIVADVPKPLLRSNCVLVRNLFSAVSPGTETAVMRSRSRNVVRTALERKDLVRRVLDKARRDGLIATITAVSRKLDASLPLGYSSAGIVVEVADDVSDLQTGDYVACAGAGHACHAEYVCVPRMLCAKLPEGVSADAAAFTTLGAIAMQGVRQAEITFGETVAILGLGIVGQFTAQIVEAAGGRTIGIDLNDSRVDIFQKSCRGAGLVISPDTEQRVLDITDGLGADRVIITAASRTNAAIELAAAICRDRGRVVVVGDVSMQLPRAPFYEKELDLRLSRSYGPGRYDPLYELQSVDYPLGYVRWTENRNMEEFLRLVQENKVRPVPLVTHRFAIDKASEPYSMMAAGGALLGALIEYPAQEQPSAAAKRIELKPRKPHKGKVGIGMLGAGNFTRAVLLPTLAKIPSAQLRAVGSAHGVNARDLGIKYGCNFCTNDLDEMLASPDVDAMVIATPHNLHAEQAVRVLKADKSVYLEKPLCLNEAELAEIMEAARASKGRLFVGYNRRFSPFGLRMREAFAGRLRPLVLDYRVNAGALPPGSWLTDINIGGGRIVGEACHFVDFAKFVIGARVRETVAGCTRESPDDVVATLNFEDGSIAAISYITSGPLSLPKERIEAVGAGKAWIIDDFRQWSFCDGRHRKSGNAPQDKGHHAALQAFVDCVAGRTECSFAIEDLEDTSRITFKMRQAGGKSSV